MRDQLIEMIADELGSINCAKLLAADIADRLLSNGVIVPPCKVGDVVYVITEKHPFYVCKWCGDWCHKDFHIKDKMKLVVKEAKVFYFCFKKCTIKCRLRLEEQNICKCTFLHFNVEDFGKTVFLTKEQAEKALAEVANGT